MQESESYGKPWELLHTTRQEEQRFPTKSTPRRDFSLRLVYSIMQQLTAGDNAYWVIGKMGTETKMRTKRYLQNHAVYQRTKMILRNPLASPVRGARQNGHAPSRAFGWAQKAMHAGSNVISLDAGYRGDAEDFQPERQLIRRLLYSHTGLSTFFSWSCTQ